MVINEEGGGRGDRGVGLAIFIEGGGGVRRETSIFDKNFEGREGT